MRFTISTRRLRARRTRPQRYAKSSFLPRLDEAMQWRVAFCSRLITDFTGCLHYDAQPYRSGCLDGLDARDSEADRADQLLAKMHDDAEIPAEQEGGSATLGMTDQAHLENMKRALAGRIIAPSTQEMVKKGPILRGDDGNIIKSDGSDALYLAFRQYSAMTHPGALAMLIELEGLASDYSKTSASSSRCWLGCLSLLQT